jgi:hypothetical protein
VALLYSFYPVEFYLRNRHLEEWMIYRLVTIMVLGVGGLNVISIGQIAERMLEVAGYRKRSSSFIDYLLNKIFSQNALLIWGGLSILSAIAVNNGTIIQYVTTGKVLVHWSYVIFGATFVLAGFQLIGLGLLLRFAGFLITRLQPETVTSAYPISEKIEAYAVSVKDK